MRLSDTGNVRERRAWVLNGLYWYRAVKALAQGHVLDACSGMIASTEDTVRWCMSEPRSPLLEERIRENPDDLAAYAIYADWLLAQGCVRGELASVQLALEHENDPRLRARARELLIKHPNLLIDPTLEPYTEHMQHVLARARWRGGFLYDIKCWLPSEVLRTLLAGPAARLLHTLHVFEVTDTDGDYSPVVTALELAGLTGLRRLRLGGLNTRYDHLGTCPNLERLALACPRLQNLMLFRVQDFSIADTPTTPSANFLELVELDARFAASATAVASLARARLPQLRTLHLGMCVGENSEASAEWAHLFDWWIPEDAQWTPETLDCLLSSFSTPRLERLFLWEPSFGRNPIFAEMAAEFVARVRASPLGRRLERLEVPEALIEDPESLYEPVTYSRDLSRPPRPHPRRRRT